jgi:hypothetical protein
MRFADEWSGELDPAYDDDRAFDLAHDAGAAEEGSCPACGELLLTEEWAKWGICSACVHAERGRYRDGGDGSEEWGE